MAKYNTFQYGTGVLYGAVPDLTHSLKWFVQIDWNEDGVLEDYNEGFNMKHIQMFRGRRNWLKPDGSGFEPLQTGQIQIVLDNTDRRYDAWNTSSVLYPNVRPGKDIKISVFQIATGTTYPVFFGTITDIRPSGYSNEPYVTIVAEDALRFLRNGSIGPHIAYAGTSVSDLIGDYFLYYISWPSRWGTSFDTCSEDVHIFVGNEPNVINPAKVIFDLADVGLHYFFIDNAGNATLRNRTSGASVETLSETNLSKDVQLSQPWGNVWNICKVGVHNFVNPPAVFHGSIDWQVTSSPSIPIGGSITLQGNYSYNGQYTQGSLWDEMSGVMDWTTNTKADGTGTDKTASCTFGNVKVYGDHFTGTWTNNAGVLVYLNKAILYDIGWTYIDGANYFPVDISTVPVPKMFTLDTFFQQHYDQAQTNANILGPVLSIPQPFPVIKLNGQRQLQFTPDLFDIVTLDIPYLGINDQTFRIGGINHADVNGVENCQAIETTFYLEPVY